MPDGGALAHLPAWASMSRPLGGETVQPVSVSLEAGGGGDARPPIRRRGPCLPGEPSVRGRGAPAQGCSLGSVQAVVLALSPARRPRAPRRLRAPDSGTPGAGQGPCWRERASNAHKRGIVSAPGSFTEASILCHPEVFILKPTSGGQEPGRRGRTQPSSRRVRRAVSWTQASCPAPPAFQTRPPPATRGDSGRET